MLTGFRGGNCREVGWFDSVRDRGCRGVGVVVV